MPVPAPNPLMADILPPPILPLSLIILLGISADSTILSSSSTTPSSSSSTTSSSSSSSSSSHPQDISPSSTETTAVVVFLSTSDGNVVQITSFVQVSAPGQPSVCSYVLALHPFEH